MYQINNTQKVMTISDVKQLAISQGLLTLPSGDQGKRELKQLRQFGFHTYPLRPLSYSSLKEFRKSPLHYIEYVTQERRSTAPMVEGKVFEALLMGQRMEDLFVPFSRPEPERDFRTKANQQARNEARAAAQASGRDAIEDQDLDRIQRIVDQAWRHPFMRHLRRYRYRQPDEKVIIEKRTRLKVLGKADLCYQRSRIGVDIKFVHSIAEFEQHLFGRSYQYWLQAAVYSLVYGYREFYFFATQSQGHPFSQAFHLDCETLAILREYLIDHVLMKFRHHLARGFFKYAEQVKIPDWMR